MSAPARVSPPLSITQYLNCDSVANERKTIFLNLV